VRARSILVLGLFCCACGEADRGGNGARGPGNSRGGDSSVSDSGNRDLGVGFDAGFGVDVGFGGDAGAQDSGVTVDGGPGAPTILMLSSNVTTLDESQQLIISAVVTDPDGVDDLIGGSLLDPTSGNAYGAFVTSAAEGSYQIILGWSAIDTVQPIDAPASGGQRRFIARFYDVAGHLAERELTITLRCSISGQSACGGDCVDLSSDDLHCGACRSPVPSGLVCRNAQPGCADTSLTLCSTECADLGYSIDHCGTCDHQCPSWSGRTPSCEGGGICSISDTFYSRISCDTICGNHGYSCTAATWYYYFTSGYAGVSSLCSDIPPEIHPTDAASTWESIACVCEHAPGGPMCPQGPENNVSACTDGCTNDGDRYIDCEDFDCCNVVSCPTGTACNP
jgi:hypothetical protein